MKTVQVKLKKSDDLETALEPILELDAHLVLAFGSLHYFESAAWVRRLSLLLPGTQIIGCSSGGEIATDGLYEDHLVLTGISFESTSVFSASVKLGSMDTSLQAGHELGDKLKTHSLNAIFVLGRGLDVNGSALIQGIRERLGDQVPITGGLAADDGRFKRTYTVLNGEVAHDRVVAIGLSGDNLSVSYGSKDGWDAFGPVRTVTRSAGNVLFELDGKPALDIYRLYLGDRIHQLPASGLLFPFQLLKSRKDALGIVRTILAVDEASKSITLAGDIPENYFIRLMHTTTDDLISGARSAAEIAAPKHLKDCFSILVSCYGRKIVMGVDIEEELDAIREIYKNSTVAGFYAYGEICPLEKGSASALHNQTMTITTIREGA